MNTRRFGCCPCCDDVALSDHVGHGGDIEKDGHEVPCKLLHDTRPAGEANGRGTYWSELDYQRVRAERDALRAELGELKAAVARDGVDGHACIRVEAYEKMRVELDALRGRVAALADGQGHEFAVIITALNAGKISGGDAIHAAEATVRNLLDGPA